MSKKSQRARKERQETRQRAQRNRRILGGVGFALLLILMVYVTWQQTTSSAAALAPEAVADPMLGAEQASIEIAEYGDFGCHACQAWHNAGIRERILETFGEQVRFVWYDFPVITPQSPKAAEAGHCAGAQDQFWAYHDYLYENLPSLDRASLRQAAVAIGLDEELFETCMDQGQMVLKVESNEQQARRLGMRGTPGFTLDGQPLAAPPSFDQLAQLINQKLTQ